MRDATVRYMVLTLAGVLLLAVVPSCAFGETPLWSVAGHAGPRPANVLGIVFVAAGWVYFTVVVSVLRVRHSNDAACRVALIADVLLMAGFLAAASLGQLPLGFALLVAATLSHLVIAARLEQVRVRIPGTNPEVVGSLR